MPGPFTSGTDHFVNASSASDQAVTDLRCPRTLSAIRVAVVAAGGSDCELLCTDDAEHREGGEVRRAGFRGP